MAAPRVLDASLGQLLGQAQHALHRDFDARVRAAGLSAPEWRVLAALHEEAPMTISQLAQAVLSKQPTVTKLVQRMAEQGWLMLAADASDQRRTLVAPTASGKRLARPLVLEAKEHEARVLRSLGATEKIALRKLLGKLAQHA